MYLANFPFLILEELCQCPQKCNDRVPQSDREHIFKYFYQDLGEADPQNKFLREHMDVKPRIKQPSPDPPPLPLPGTRPPRRITCKYLLPLLPSLSDKIEVCQKAFCSAFVISTKRVRLQREKLIHSLGLNSYHHQKSVKKKRKLEDANGMATLGVFIDNCDQEVRIDITKHLDNLEDVTEESSVKMASTGTRLVDDPLIPMGISVPEGVTIAPVTATPDHDRDIAIVNNFFSNQLWKPEYIGAHS